MTALPLPPIDPREPHRAWAAEHFDSEDVGALGIAVVLAGLFIWPDLVDVLVPLGVLAALVGWRVRWAVRPWLIPRDASAPWLTRLIVVALLLWLAFGIAGQVAS